MYMYFCDIHYCCRSMSHVHNSAAFSAHPLKLNKRCNGFNLIRKTLIVISNTRSIFSQFLMITWYIAYRRKSQTLPKTVASTAYQLLISVFGELIPSVPGCFYSKPLKTHCMWHRSHQEVDWNLKPVRFHWQAEREVFLGHQSNFHCADIIILYINGSFVELYHENGELQISLHWTSRCCDTVHLKCAENVCWLWFHSSSLI